MNIVAGQIGWSEEYVLEKNRRYYRFVDPELREIRYSYLIEHWRDIKNSDLVQTGRPRILRLPLEPEHIILTSGTLNREPAGISLKEDLEESFVPLNGDVLVYGNRRNFWQNWDPSQNIFHAGIGLFLKEKTGCDTGYQKKPGIFGCAPVLCIYGKTGYEGGPVVFSGPHLTPEEDIDWEKTSIEVAVNGKNASSRLAVSGQPEDLVSRLSSATVLGKREMVAILQPDPIPSASIPELGERMEFEISINGFRPERYILTVGDNRGDL